MWILFIFNCISSNEEEVLYLETIELSNKNSKNFKYVCNGEDYNFNFSNMLEDNLNNLNRESYKNKVVICCSLTYKKVHDDYITKCIEYNNQTKHFVYRGIIFRDLKNFIPLTNTELAFKLGLNSAAVLVPSELTKDAIINNTVLEVTERFFNAENIVGISPIEYKKMKHDRISLLQDIGENIKSRNLLQIISKNKIDMFLLGVIQVLHYL